MNTCAAPLDQYWAALNCELDDASTLDEINISTDWTLAHAEFLRQLEPIEDLANKLDFLKSLTIEASQPSLVDIERDVVRLLEGQLGITPGQASVLLENLDHAIRRWASSSRHEEVVTPEDVVKALSAQPSPAISDHHLAPPEPFFESRQG